MNKGITLLELIVVIAIFTVLSTLLYGNFATSLRKGRDAKRKTDLANIQRALEMYYEDEKRYPGTLNFGGQLISQSSGKVYMEKIPKDPTSSQNYRYCVDNLNNPQRYQLYTRLENLKDPAIITPAPLSYCTADCPNCNYGISSTNTSAAD